MATAALVASCRQCECEDRHTIVEKPSMVPSFAFSEAAEELVNPKERCKSWDIEPQADSSHAERHLAFRLAPGDCFGLQFLEAPSDAAQQSLLVVVNVDQMSVFGKTIDGQLGISVGDIIVEANGGRGTAAQVRDALQQVVASSGTKHVTLVTQPRPATFEVELRREGVHWQKLGVTAVVDKNNPSRLLVQAVAAEGLVPEWNKTHGSCKVFAGDTIKEINGTSGNAAAMLNAIRSSSHQGAVLKVLVTPANGGHAAAMPRDACEWRARMKMGEAVAVPRKPTRQATHRMTQLRTASAERSESLSVLPPRLARKLNAFTREAGLEGFGAKENSVDLDSECSDDDFMIDIQFTDESFGQRALRDVKAMALGLASSQNSKSVDCREEDRLSEASTEFPASGTATPVKEPRLVWV